MHSLSRHPTSTTWSIRGQTCSQTFPVLLKASSARTEALVRELRSHHAALVAAPQPLPAVLAADGSGEDPSRLGPRGPKLLPRPVRPKADGSSSNKNSGGGAGGGGGRGPTGAGERTLASLAAYSGLVGTAALLLGNLAGIDLWGEFDWTSLDDLRMAAVASVPLQLLNAALLLPSFSSPQRLPDLGNLDAMEAKLKAEHERRTEQPAAPAAAAATAAAAVSGVSPAAESAAAATAASAPASPSSPPAAATAAAGDSPSEAAGSQGLVPADAWGRSRGDAEAKPGAEDAWTALRSALHLAQGYYISNNPTARLTPAAEAAYSFIDGAAGEMLYRGVALTWLASWLQDRVYEAGFDEALSYNVPAAAAALGLPQLGDALASLGVYGACECAVAAGTASFVVLSVLSRSRRAAQRLELLMSAASSASSLRPGDRTRATTANGGGGGKAGAAAGASAGAAAGSSSSNSNSSPGAGTNGTGARAAAQVLFGPGGPSLGASGAGVVMQRAAAIQATRDAFQILLINAVFIASGGNLAASYAVSVANQLAISAMQRRGVRRMRERSAALARELRAYNAQMQRIASKYKDKLPKATAVRLEGMDEEASPSTPASGNVSGGSGPAPASTSGFTDAASSGSSSGSSRSESATSASGSGGNVGSESVGAHHGSSGGGDGRGAGALAPLASSATIGESSGSSPSGSGSGSGIDSSSNLGRALAMLDRLVPEPPKPAANSGQRRQQAQEPPQPQPQQQRLQ